MPLLNIFGELETLIADHLYPYRYVITPVLIAALLGVAYAAYRMGLHRIVLRNPLPSAAIGMPLTDRGARRRQLFRFAVVGAELPRRGEPARGCAGCRLQNQPSRRWLAAPRPVVARR